MTNSKFRRSNKKREQNPRFLIISEGEITERQYLEAVKRSRRIVSADLKFVPPGPTSPMEIVTKARNLRNEALKDDPFDFVWCIFDVEAKVGQRARPRLSEAVEMARQNKIWVALSNPCIELWILLHHEDWQASIASDACQNKCAKLALVVKKHLQKPDELFAQYPSARRNAINLDQKHDRDGVTKPEDRNPSSSIYKLVDAICSAFPPRQ